LGGIKVSKYFALPLLLLLFTCNLEIQKTKGDSTYFQTIYPEKDTYINEGLATKNFGGQNILKVGYSPPNGGDLPTNKYILIQFDINSLPSDASIKHAYLKLYLTGGGDTTLRVERITSPWDERGAIWNNQPSIWTYTGLFIPLLMDIGASGHTYSIEITNIVKDWFEGNYANYGLILMPSERDPYSNCEFYSSEYTGEIYDIRRPRLEVGYESVTPPSPTPTPSPPEPEDTTPPTVTISTDPTEDIMPTDVVTITAEAEDDVGLDSLYLEINGHVVKQEWAEESGVMSLYATYNTYLSFGTHIILAQAWDRAGHPASISMEIIVGGLPKLEILSAEPITQYGSTLVARKQTLFKFDYTFEYWSEIEVDFRLHLSRYWETTLPWARDEGDHTVIEDRVTLKPTIAGKPKTVYLFESLEGIRGGGFLPMPRYKMSSPYTVQIEIDPYNRVDWDEDSTLSISSDFYTHFAPEVERVKIVFFEHVGGGILGAVRHPFTFTDAENHELAYRLLWDSYYSGDPYPYELYLSAIFPARFVHNRNWAYWRSGTIGWWDADTLGEEAADEGYSRVIAICPPGAIARVEGGSTIGVVYHRCYGRYDQSYYTAFVDYYEALDQGRYEYFPVVAHELSHTYRFPDIYGGDRQIVFDYDYVYFDEIQGGIVKIFKNDKYMPPDTTPTPVKGRSLTPLTLPCNISAWDIMHYAGLDKSDYWSHASYEKVASYISDDDPPEGLLISMILFRNGTVLERPFQKLYNHTFGFPGTDAVGNFSLVLYDRDGMVFRNYPYNVSFYYSVEPGGLKRAEAVPFLTLTEWTDDLGRIELVDLKGKVWFRRDVSDHLPELEVIFPSEGKKLGIETNYTILWEGTDIDGDPLWYTVLVQKKGDILWKSLASRIQKNEVFFVPPAEFEEGDYLIQIKATDGVNTAVKFVEISLVEELKLYTVLVDSNIELSLAGSGKYEEGEKVKIDAPTIVMMEKLFGLLGGKYKFSYWKGAVESKENKIIIDMVGEETDLKITAIYEADYSETYLRLGILVIILFIVILLLVRLRR